MLEIKRELWLCEDCTIGAVNGDFSGMDDDRAEEVDGALRKVGGHLSAHFDSEAWEGIKDFSSWPCDCCHSRLAGSRHRFAVLGEVERLGLSSQEGK